MKKSAHEKATEIAFSIIKEQPCSFRGCGAMSSDGPQACVAGEQPHQCQRRKASAKHSGSSQRRRGGKVKHLSIEDVEDY
jgi:hypothetical protein